MATVTTWPGRKPGSSEVSWRKLWTRRPAPTRSTKATATSAVTSSRRSRRRPAPGDALRLPPRSRSPASTPAASRAGARPKSTLVASERRRAKTSTLVSTRTAALRNAAATSGGISASSAEISSAATTSPAAPPSSASTALSVRSCRTRRPRAAPRAARTAISGWRAAARARRRLAVFAHAISMTRATAAEKSSRAGRRSATSARCRGTTLRNVSNPYGRFAFGGGAGASPMGRAGASGPDRVMIIPPRGAAGAAATAAAWIASSSWRACSSVTSGRRRPITCTRLCRPRARSPGSSSASGSSRSTSG